MLHGVDDRSSHYISKASSLCYNVDGVLRLRRARLVRENGPELRLSNLIGTQMAFSASSRKHVLDTPAHAKL